MDFPTQRIDNTEKTLMEFRINSSTPGRFEWHFRYAIFKQLLVNDGWNISGWIDLKRMSLDLTDDKSALVQVVAWCRQASIR